MRGLLVDAEVERVEARVVAVGVEVDGASGGVIDDSGAAWCNAASRGESVDAAVPV